MTRPTTLFMLVLAVAAIAVLFQVSLRVSTLRDELGVVNRDTAADREAINVLRTEWAYLARPERVAALSAKYLAMAPMATSQIATFAAVPVRLPPLPVDAVPADDVATRNAPSNEEIKTASTLAARPLAKPSMAPARRPAMAMPRRDRRLDDVLADLLVPASAFQSWERRQ